MTAGKNTLRAGGWSIVGLAAGVAAGSVMRAAGLDASHPLTAVLGGLGALWMNALRAVAIPLAVFNTVSAMARERGGRAAGRIGAAFGLYTALLLAGAAIVVTFLPPILHSTHVDQAAVAALSETAKTPVAKARPAPGTSDLIGGIMPRNVLQAWASDDFLPLLVFASLFGLALKRTSAENGATVIRFVDGVSETLLVLVRWIAWCSPVAMFALAATFATTSGARIVGILGRFVAYECAFLLAFGALFYPLTALLGGISLRRFARAAMGPQTVAISTRSSMAALPSLLEAGEEMLPETPHTSRVILPLAVAMFKVNRTTSAMCRLLMILYFWNVPTDAAHVLTFLATTMVLSLSDLGIPGGTGARGLPAYLAAGCPLAPVVLFEVVEPFSDLCKTLVNVTGDLSLAAIVTRWSERPEPVRAMVAVGSRAS